MKTYTHPTINLPAGAVVVKFYDDSLTGSETMPDCILEVGDVEEGFDISLGELRLPSLDIKLRNVNDYVFSTLLNTQTLRVSVVVDNENYFYGIVNLNIDPSLIEVVDGTRYGDITITCEHVFSLLNNVTIEDIAADLASIVDPFDPWLYMRQFFRLIAEACYLKFVSFSDIVYVVHRSYAYYDTGLAQYVYYALDKLMFLKYAVDLDLTPHENYFTKRNETLFEILGDLARDLLFFPSVKYDGTDFKLKIMERDYQSNISFDAKEVSPSRKYLLKDITTSLANIPLTVDNTDLYFRDAANFAVGDTFNLDLHFTNIERSDGLAATSGGTLSTTAIDIAFTGTNGITAKEGRALITHSGATIEFSYNHKTATAFKGCTIGSGTFAFSAGDLITNTNSVYGTNILLKLKNSTVNGEEAFDKIVNLYPSNLSYTALHEAIHEAYKYLYLNRNEWREVIVHGLKGDDGYGAKLEYLMPGYQTALWSYLHSIHTVKKSVMRNESELTMLKIAAL